MSKEVGYEINVEDKLGSNETVNILGVDVDKLNMIETVQLVESYVKTKTPLHLMGVNADKLNAASKDPFLKKIINSCGIVNADGISVVYASKFLKNPLPERVAGIDLMYELLEIANEMNYSIYLLGATQEVIEKTVCVLKQDFRNLNIVGYRNGYFSDEVWLNISNELLALNPDMVFVGITSPTKEYLIEFLQKQGVKSVFMGVGGSFDVVSGKITRAPIWMQKIGLEWLHRVIKEPKRLFKRYFLGNLKFILNIIAFKCKERQTL